MITDFSCTTLCTRVGGVEGGSSLLSACLFYSSSTMLHRLDSDPGVLKRVCFSDESTFLD